MAAWVEDTGRLRSVRGGKYSWLSVLWKRYKKKGPRCSATCHRGFTESGQPASSGVQEGLFSSHRAHHHTAMRSLKQAPQRHRDQWQPWKSYKVAPEPRLQKMPRRPPSGSSFHDREEGTRLYFQMCLDKEVTLFRLLGNPGQRAAIQTGTISLYSLSCFSFCCSPITLEPCSQQAKRLLTSNPFHSTHPPNHQQMKPCDEVPR